MSTYDTKVNIECETVLTQM